MSTHLEPSAKHPITITPSKSRLRVKWNGHVVAETDHALDLKEASYPTVHYIPRADVNMSFFERTSRSTHCPLQGRRRLFHPQG